MQPAVAAGTLEGVDGEHTAQQRRPVHVIGSRADASAVGARFVLDAMPGKQMAIDAEMRAGGTPDLLEGLVDAGLSFIVVGGAAGVILGAPIVTLDLDIVHQKTPENIDRLFTWLLEHGAYHRLDLGNRRLPPTHEQLSGEGHLNLQLDMGKLG